MNNWKRLAIGLANLLLFVILTGEAQATHVQRTCYLVSNLSCSSCLATIEAELKGLPGTIGMEADLQRGRVIVDHQPELDYEKIGSAITNAGYPAQVNWTATIPARKALAANAKYGTRNGTVAGSGCTTRKEPCNATAASWKNLYKRYVGKPNAQ